MNAKISILRVPAANNAEDLRAIARVLMKTIVCPDGNAKRICFADQDGFGWQAFQTFAEEMPGIKLQYHNDNWGIMPKRSSGPVATPADIRYDSVIGLCSSENMYGLVRFVHNCFLGAPPVITIAPAADGCSQFSLEECQTTLGPDRPIAAMLFPGAGSARLLPVFSRLMEYHQLHYASVPMISLMKRFIRSDIDPQQQITQVLFGAGKIPQDAVDNAYRDIIQRMCDCYQWCAIHDPVSTAMFGSLKEMRTIYLYRDPRDIINSFYHRLVYDGIEEDFCELRKMDKDEALINLLQGMDYVNSRRNFFMRWPSLEEMARNFVDIREFPNIYGIRYEDIRYHPREAYRALLHWLELDSIPLRPPPSDALLDEAIHLGTFHAQSDGNIREGEGDGQNVYRKKSGASTALRKGVAGDWKNNFSPKVCEIVKEMAGAALIELGYEKDKNWQPNK